MRQTPNLNVIPKELTAQSQWVLWRYEPSGDKKPKKVPINARTGGRASTTDPKSWSSFQKTTEAYEISQDAAGIGFVFTQDDPYCGIDLDDCREKEFASWAKRILNQFPTYAEISPSGCGVKLICKGELPAGGKKTAYADGAVEMYDQGRYFTITGQVIGTTEVNHCQRSIDWLYNEVFYGKRRQRKAQGNKPAIGDVQACWRVLEAGPDSVEGQGGSDVMLWACCEALRHGIIGKPLTALLLKYNREKCQPPWSEDELRHKIDSALTKVVEEGQFGYRCAEFQTARSSQRDDGFQIPTIINPELDAKELRIDFVVDKILAEDMGGVIGGPKKVLKTSIATDLAISIASGTPFLGEFNVTKKKRVFFISGETVEAGIQEISRRVLQSREIDVSETEGLTWSFCVPQLQNTDHLRKLCHAISDHGSEIVILDPAYMMVFEGSKQVEAANMFQAGPALRQVELSIKQETGANVIYLHHTLKHESYSYKPPDLDELQMSGWAAWAPQWLLLGRRTSPDLSQGLHRLVFSAGGRAGHHGEYGLDVNEGQLDPLIPRQWDVDIFDVDSAKDRDRLNRVDTESVQASDLVRILLDILPDDGQEPISKREIIKRLRNQKTKFRDATFHEAIAQGKADCTIWEIEKAIRGRSTGFTKAPNLM